MLCYRCGRVVEFFDIACARTCDRVRVCVCEIGAPDKPCGEAVLMLTQKHVAKRYIIAKK